MVGGVSSGLVGLYLKIMFMFIHTMYDAKHEWACGRDSSLQLAEDTHFYKTRTAPNSVAVGHRINLNVPHTVIEDYMHRHHRDWRIL